MRCITELDKKKYYIPRDDEFNFRKRAKALVTKWEKVRVASVKSLDLETAKVSSMETELQGAENEGSICDVGASTSRLQMEKEVAQAQMLDWKRKYVVLQQENDDLERRYIVAKWSSTSWRLQDKATDTLSVIEEGSE
ncbi:hypothetical protein MPER_05345 [Moniliophthora perniciosa FA553]|nr:hypothetical protein MPER_05345 [Moniliophthora perniciosa FA553]